MVLYLPLVLASLTLLLLTGLRCEQRSLPLYTWHLFDPLPAIVLGLAAWVGGIVFAKLGHITARYAPELVWSGACVVCLPALLVWGRWRVWVAAAFLTLASLILLGDVWYLRYFGGLAPIAAFGSGGQLWEVRDSIEAVSQSADWVLAPLFLLGPLMLALWPRRIPKLDWRLQCGGTLLLLGLGCWGAVPLQRDVRTWLGDSHSWKIFNSRLLILESGIWGAHARDVAQTLREFKQQQELSQQRSQAIADFHAARVSAPTPFTGQARGLNLLLVQIEALQQWVLDARPDGNPVMPFVEELKSRGVYYANVWDQTGNSPTADCEYLVMNSQHPLARGAVAFRRASNDFVGLPQLLNDAGYQTVSAHAFSPSMWNRSVLHPKYGFSRGWFRDELGEKPKLGWGLEDRVFFTRSVERLKELPSPWFAFLITLTSHHPYTYLPPARWSLPKGRVPEPLAPYLNSMRYVDDALRELFASLQAARLLDSTLVVLYGDHESKLSFSGQVAREAAQRLKIDPGRMQSIARRGWADKKIPVLLVPPSRAEPAEVTAIGGQIDLGPTLLDWLGVEASAAYLGRPIGGLLESEPPLVARHDGSAVGVGLMWEAPRKRCSTRAGAKRPARDCLALLQRGAEELEASWDVTLHDLARHLHDAGRAHGR